MSLYKDTRFDPEMVMCDIVDKVRASASWTFLKFFSILDLYNACMREKLAVGICDEIPITFFFSAAWLTFLFIRERRAWRWYWGVFDFLSWTPFCAWLPGTLARSCRNPARNTRLENSSHRAKTFYGVLY